MASELGIAIKIGAVTGGLMAALGGVKQTIGQLGRASDQLTARQKALGASIERQLGTLAPRTLASLNRDYERLGRTIDRLNAKQTKLLALQARGESLQQGRAALRGQVLDTVALGVTAVAPVKLAIDFESAMADVRKVVDFEEPAGFKKLGDTLLQMSRTIPLTAAELAAIAASGGQLGVKESDLPQFTETIAKMATAFDMSAAEAGMRMASLANVYNLPITQIGRLGDAINQLSNESPARAGDIVEALGRVGGVAKQFGLTEIQAASLSNALISLGKPPQIAANAINGMLTKLQTADKQGEKFQQALAGIGMSASGLKQAIERDAQGALLSFLGQLDKVPKSERMGILVDLFGLEYADDVAVLAGSMQTYADAIHTVQKRGKDGKLAFEGSMEKEFQARAETTRGNLITLKNSLAELGITVGAAVLPGFNALIQDIKPLVYGFTAWAQANPGLVSGLVKLVAGMAALHGTQLVARYGFSLLASSGLGAVRTIHLLHGKWLLLTQMFRGGSGLFTLLRVFRTGSGFAANLPTHLARLGGWLGRLGGWALSLGRILGGGLLSGLRLAGQAVLWLGRALLMNPIGLLITGIGLAAYLVWKYWGPIKGFVGRLWGSIKAFFNSGIDNISRKILDWSPLGLFYKAFSSVLRYFGINLPGSFSEFGSNLINGLIGGIKSKFTAARDAIVGFGSDIKGWFTETLGIQSPSRVFMGFGDNIAQGAAIGIRRTGPLAARAAAAMAAATVAASPAGAAGSTGGHVTGGHAFGGGITVHFSPQITVHGGADAKEAVMEASRLSLAELERLLRRLQAQQQRRGN